ncbi:hypothetical protein LOK49_Contig50G00009 [Camellia lanceoleosa]|nr:hypothetical protein LOK49_Contig50G00009 [Camellia lanceoleosa]
MKITRLGSGSKNGRRVWKIRLSPKLRFKVALLSPMKLLAKFHEAYVGMMVRMVGDNDIDLFGGKRIPKGRSLPMMVSSSNEIVDGKLVLEIYKRREGGGNLAKRPGTNYSKLAASLDMSFGC